MVYLIQSWEIDDDGSVGGVSISEALVKLMMTDQLVVFRFPKLW